MTDLRVTSDAPPASMMFPIPSEAALQQLYIGKRLADLENLPAAIVDVAVVRKNCDRMLALTEKLGMGFRAHIKTHKVSYANDTVTEKKIITRTTLWKYA